MDLLAIIGNEDMGNKFKDFATSIFNLDIKFHSYGRLGSLYDLAINERLDKKEYFSFNTNGIEEYCIDKLDSVGVKVEEVDKYKLVLGVCNKKVETFCLHEGSIEEVVSKFKDAKKVVPSFYVELAKKLGNFREKVGRGVDKKVMLGVEDVSGSYLLKYHILRK